MPRKKQTKKADAKPADVDTAKDEPVPESKPSHTHKDPKVEMRYGIPVKNR